MGNSSYIEGKFARHKLFDLNRSKMYGFTTLYIGNVLAFDKD